MEVSPQAISNVTEAVLDKFAIGKTGHWRVKPKPHLLLNADAFRFSDPSITAIALQRKNSIVRTNILLICGRFLKIVSIPRKEEQ